MNSKYDFEELLAFANSDSEKRIFKTILEERSIRKAARKLNRSNGTITSAIKRVWRRIEEARGKDVKLVPIEDKPSLVNEVKGTSTLYDAKGNVKLQWVKEDIKANLIAKTIQNAVEAFKVSGVQSPAFIGARPISSNGLLAQYTIADYHLGMMASEDESGEEWNTDIAVEKLVKVIDEMTMMVPATEYAVINILGDFLHSDSLLPVTPASRHVLAQDKRYPDLIGLAVRSIDYLVQRAKQKANTVTLLIAQGNHDPIGSLWLQELFSYYYLNDENVNVVKSSNPFYCIEFGDTMLMYHHGDKVQFDKMHQFAPSLFPEAWGRTKYRYAHMGDKHHRRVKEAFGIIVEQHQTLAPRDNYSSSHGWTSESGANVIVYSKTKGEVSRINVRR